MIPLKGFYNENTLQELLAKGNISKLEYIYHHSQEMIDEFKSFCQINHQQEDETAAMTYFEKRY